MKKSKKSFKSKDFLLVCDALREKESDKTPTTKSVYHKETLRV